MGTVPTGSGPWSSALPIIFVKRKLVKRGAERK